MPTDYTINQSRRNRRIHSVVDRNGQRWLLLWHRDRWVCWVLDHADGSAS